VCLKEDRRRMCVGGGDREETVHARKRVLQKGIKEAGHGGTYLSPQFSGDRGPKILSLTSALATERVLFSKKKKKGGCWW
jgi:hypothetical protein